MKNKFYTYAYLREDGTPYYIGKGKHKSDYKSRKYFRAHYGKHSLSVPPKERILILKDNISEEQAFKHERYMISILGRKDIGTGILRNLTDGGEGFSGFKLTEERKRDISKRIKKYIEENGNPRLKKFLLINVNGEHYIVDDGLDNFCKNKNIPHEAIQKRKSRGFDAPTKCGWMYFDITHKTKEEIEVIKNQFLLQYKNRINNKLDNLNIPSNINVANKSINIIFNFINDKIQEISLDCKNYNGKNYVKISEDEFKKSGVSVKTAFRCIKVLKENNFIDVQKLNKRKLDRSNYYTIL